MEAKGQVEVAAPSARTVKRRVLRAQTTARGERRGCTRQRKKPLAGEPRRSVSASEDRDIFMSIFEGVSQKFIFWRYNVMK